MQSFSFYAMRLPEYNHKLFSQPVICATSVSQTPPVNLNYESCGQSWVTVLSSAVKRIVRLLLLRYGQTTIKKRHFL